MRGANLKENAVTLKKGEIIGVYEVVVQVTYSEQNFGAAVRKQLAIKAWNLTKERTNEVQH